MNDVENFLNGLMKKKMSVDSKIKKAVSDSCVQVQRTIVKGMTETETDATKSYYKHNKKKAHHPSVANDYPAIDTGTLRRSITFDVKEENGKTVGRVGSTMTSPPYGFYLETGTSKMAKRPWLKPSLEQNKSFIREKLNEALKDD